MKIWQITYADGSWEIVFAESYFDASRRAKSDQIFEVWEVIIT